MSGFGKRLDGPGGRRRAARAPILMSAALHTVGASRTVSLLDVSTDGARVRTPLPLQPGQEVWLKVPQSQLFGRVKWVEGNQCGIRFDEPLSEAEAADLKARGKVVIMSRLGPDEQLAIEDWKAGLAR